MNAPELTALCREYLERTGWRVWTFASHRALPTGARGFFDLVAVRDGVSIFAEIKGAGDRMRGPQVETGEWMRENGVGECVRYGAWESVEDCQEMAEREL